MHIELAGIWKPAFSLWYSIEPQTLIPILPSGFQPYCRKSRGFWNVFISRMEYMRPTGLPAWCGIHCWQIIYSTYVTSTAEASGEVKGLYVVQSEIEQKHFSRLSSLMPYFHFRPANIEVSENEEKLNLKIRNENSADSLMIDSRDDSRPYRSQSLGSFSEAMNFLQYRNTFVLTSGDFLEFGDLNFNPNEIPIAGPIGSFQFLSDMNQNDLQLELATKIECADFHLILGRRERPALRTQDLPLHEFAEIDR